MGERIPDDRTQAGIVVLLPGLWMPSIVMMPLAARLHGSGFATARFDYPSRRATLSENALRLVAFVHTLAARRVHLVGHSLGGIVAVHAACRHRIDGLARIVLMGSPYQDSYAGRRLARTALGRRLVGRTVSQWLETPREGAPDGVSVGVLAGTLAMGLGMLVAPHQPRPTDGVVTVAETRVPGMCARVCLPVSHSGMLFSARVAACVANFLRHGTFEPPVEPSRPRAT